MWPRLEPITSSERYRLWGDEPPRLPSFVWYSEITNMQDGEPVIEYEAIVGMQRYAVYVSAPSRWAKYWSFSIDAIDPDGHWVSYVFNSNDTEKDSGYPSAEDAIAAAERYYYRNLDGIPFTR